MAMTWISHIIFMTSLPLHLVIFSQPPLSTERLLDELDILKSPLIQDLYIIASEKNYNLLQSAENYVLLVFKLCFAGIKILLYSVRAKVES